MAVLRLLVRVLVGVLAMSCYCDCGQNVRGTIMDDLASWAPTESRATPVEWTVETGFPVAATSDGFVSLALDLHPSIDGPTWGVNASALLIDYKNPRLIEYARAHRGSYLRIGGPQEDELVFDLDGACGRSRGGNGKVDPVWCMSPAKWGEILAFGEETGLGVVFGLNVMYGRNCTVRCEPQPCDSTISGPCSAWDPSNAEALLRYTAERGLRVAGFGLGNEKDLNLTPEDYADCMDQLRAMLNKYFPRDRRPLLMGPDMHPRDDWLVPFLRSGAASSMDALSYHIYPGWGADDGLLSDIISGSYLHTARILATTTAATLLREGKGMRAWVTETAASFNSGRPGVTDAYADGFWFIDQLGMLAQLGHAVMCRQALVGGNYTMAGVNDGYTPRPDMFTSLLFKKLMGSNVLASYEKTPKAGGRSVQLRAYAHCSRTHPGGVAMAVLNFHPSDVYSLEVAFPRVDGTLGSTRRRLEYLLEPDSSKADTASRLSSKTMILNGKHALTLDEHDRVPPLEEWGREVVVAEGDAEAHLVVPPHTYGFVVFPDVRAAACR